MIHFSSLFGAHAVLQRNLPIPVWGETLPGSLVTLQLAETTIWTIADSRGRFFGRFPARPEGGPYRLSAALPSGETVQSEDIYLGEVWLAGGQSNMEMPLCGFERPVPEADRKQLTFSTPVRLFAVERDVPRLTRLHRECEVNGHWSLPESEELPQWSACAAFFAAKLSRELTCPIGIISANLGGTVIESWMSFEALNACPEIRTALNAYERRVRGPEISALIRQAWPQAPRQEEVYRHLIAAALRERGIDIRQPSEGRETSYYDDSDWQSVSLPGIWQQTMNLAHSGIVWFRREVEIPPAWHGRTLRLELGAIDKQDVTFFNGVEVGRTGRDFDFKYWNQPRIYPIPGCEVQAGRAVIAVRVFSFMFSGGLTGPAESMRLTCPDFPEESIDLSGVWRGRMTLNLEKEQFTAMMGYGNPNSFHALFDSMIHPLVGYALRGVIWYQGEGNADHADMYEMLMTRLIADWRERWGQPEFAFLQVLLAGWEGKPEEAVHWPEIRQAQRNAALRTGTGFVSAVDLGERMDIHPLAKRKVGERLAAQALADAYKRNPPARSPELKTIVREAVGQIRLYFDFAAGLHCRNGTAPRGIEIAGTDRRFREAVARVDAESVVLDPEPDVQFVRYAWSGYPDRADLYNAAGWPLLPFYEELPPEAVSANGKYQLHEERLPE